MLYTSWILDSDSLISKISKFEIRNSKFEIFLAPCTLRLVPFRFLVLTVNYSPHNLLEISLELAYTTKLMSNLSAAALSLMPMASDMPMGRERWSGPEVRESSAARCRKIEIHPPPALPPVLDPVVGRGVDPGR